ncbi:MAG: hypothetical protein ACK4MI_00010 [Brevundimonas sp.]|uniref:Esterase/lipase n=1 Tax=Brevundimonas vesicularis TaxID=41276 RepID=A0A7W9L785_BREVE|nr:MULTISPECIES: hypothetical protein [Brevundimonas]MBB5773232.1 esterase/lipase [Brevundimonas vesicularis]MCK6103180.1 hypothetical protein [Brevundimonas sp. EYE_349]MDX2335518.1 hypothetical protein [Brevundimonas vesicularis]
MSSRPTCLERAYQLAESGSCRDLREIAAALKREGFTGIRAQLEGRSLTNALRALYRSNFRQADEATG